MQMTPIMPMDHSMQKCMYHIDNWLLFFLLVEIYEFYLITVDLLCITLLSVY